MRVAEQAVVVPDEQMVDKAEVMAEEELVAVELALGANALVADTKEVAHEASSVLLSNLVKKSEHPELMPVGIKDDWAATTVARRVATAKDFIVLKIKLLGKE